MTIEVRTLAPTVALLVTFVLARVLLGALMSGAAPAAQLARQRQHLQKSGASSAAAHAAHRDPELESHILPSEPLSCVGSPGASGLPPCGIVVNAVVPPEIQTARAANVSAYIDATIAEMLRWTTMKFVGELPVALATNVPRLATRAALTLNVTIISIPRNATRDSFFVASHSPFERTLYVNASVRFPIEKMVNAPPTLLFHLLDFYDVLAPPLPRWELQAITQFRSISRANLFHTGLFLFRKNVRTANLWARCQTFLMEPFVQDNAVAESFALQMGIRMGRVRVVPIDPIHCVDHRWGVDKCAMRRNRIQSAVPEEQETMRCDWMHL